MLLAGRIKLGKTTVIRELILAHSPTVLQSGSDGVSLHFTEDSQDLPGESLCLASAQIFILCTKL